VARHLGVHQTIVTRAYASDEKGNGVSPALLNAMVAKGYLDAHEVNEVLTVAVTPCPECGEAHTTKTCVYNRKGRDRGRTFAARLPDDLFDKITAKARQLEITNGEFVAAMWSAYLDMEYIHPFYADGIRQSRLADAATEE
jgi:hypothetical protein